MFVMGQCMCRLDHSSVFTASSSANLTTFIFFPLAVFASIYFAAFDQSMKFKSRIKHMLARMHDVEHQTPIKVNKLRGIGPFFLTASQGGSLRMADFCMPDLTLRVLCRLIDCVIDDRN